MTQLDRLEALYKEWYATDSTDRASVLELQLTEALPDLIRVARAANEVIENGRCETYSWAESEAFDRAREALAPLYREVEG